MVLDKIREIVAEQFVVDAEQIGEDTAFARRPGVEYVDKDGVIACLDADSLDVAVMTAAIEDEFGLAETPEDVMTTIVTVGDLASYVAQAVGE